MSCGFASGPWFPSCQVVTVLDASLHSRFCRDEGGIAYWRRNVLSENDFRRDMMTTELFCAGY